MKSLKTIGRLLAVALLSSGIIALGMKKNNNEAIKFKTMVQDKNSEFYKKFGRTSLSTWYHNLFQKIETSNDDISTKQKKLEKLVTTIKNHAKTFSIV